MKNFYSIIPRINVALIISGFLLGGYLLSVMSRPYQVVSLDEKAMKVPPLDAGVKSLLGAPQFSADAFKKSELFRSSGKKSPAQDTKSFVLLGVSMGEKKLAILRDTKTNKDYYCTEGDIVAEYTIKDISRDKIVMEYEGNTLEITR
jgi:type II secretory pathway component PulC